eukprot:sb/3477263/
MFSVELLFSSAELLFAIPAVKLGQHTVFVARKEINGDFVGIRCRPFKMKGLEGMPRWGGIHNQSYLQFQIRYRNRFGIVRKKKIRAFKCNWFEVFILSWGVYTFPKSRA